MNNAITQVYINAVAISLLKNLTNSKILVNLKF